MTVKSPQPGDLDPIETASRDEITALQLQRLQWSVRHTYDNVAPYRKRCEEAGVHPDDLKSLADLAKFPFMTKTDLRDNYPFGLFAVPRDKVARLHASSGTTGKSVVVGYTKRDLDNWADVVARSLRAAGIRAGDMVHNAYGYGMFTGGLGAHYGIERAGCTAAIQALLTATQAEANALRAWSQARCTAAAGSSSFSSAGGTRLVATSSVFAPSTSPVKAPRKAGGRRASSCCSS